MLIVGSKALKYHFPNLNREVKDIDIIGTKIDIDYLIEILCPEKVVSTKWITTLFKIQKKDSFFNTDNVEILNSSQSKCLSKYLKHQNNSEPLPNGLRWASKEVLLSLKKSHINFPIKFQKHIIDYNILLNDLKDDKLKTITKLNFQEAQERLGELKTPSLKNKTTNFFGQSEKFVKYFYVHDDLHKVMAHYNQPIYLDMQVDESNAWCEKSLWNEFDLDKKIKCVLEEAYVIALERKIIPMLNGISEPISSKSAFDWALMRICTTLCSGWFREFATDNWSKIVDQYDKDYVLRFLEAESSGLIKKV
jgi:hypothetical protein